MEDTQHKNNWQLVRTSNGEWISDEYAVFPNRLIAAIYQMKAARYGVKLSKHPHCDGTIWYYKHEIEILEATVEKKEQEEKKEQKEKPAMTRRLKIASKQPDETLDF